MSEYSSKGFRRKFKRDAADKLLHAADERARRNARRSQRAFASDEEMREKVTLSQGEMDAWNQIAAGRPMRNSTAVLNAIKMKMEYTVQKPAQKVEEDKRVTVEVVTLGPDPGPVVEVTPRTEDEPPPNPPYDPRRANIPAPEDTQ